MREDANRWGQVLLASLCASPAPSDHHSTPEETNVSITVDASGRPTQIVARSYYAQTWHPGCGTRDVGRDQAAEEQVQRLIAQHSLQLQPSTSGRRRVVRILLVGNARRPRLPIERLEPRSGANRAELNIAFRRAQAVVAACTHASPALSRRVHFTLSGQTGRITRVLLEGDWSNREVARCAQDGLNSAEISISPFRGEELTIRFDVGATTGPGSRPLPLPV